MIRFEEHIYSDDPLNGHPDVRTRLKDVEYFFFGNGKIQGAVQYSPSGDGSPFGLLVMDPDKLSMKRDALTMDKSDGLSGTAIYITENNIRGSFDRNGKVRWNFEAIIPRIEVSWLWRDIKITELIYCKERKNPVVTREVCLENLTSESRKVHIQTSVRKKTIFHNINSGGAERVNFTIDYALSKAGETGLKISDNRTESASSSFWKDKSRIKSDNKEIERFFNASASQLASMISSAGKMDASVWQYNREWVRDHSFMCLGLIYSGHFELARRFLERLLNEFVSEEGDTIDSSERRDHDEVELDQNGELLYTLNEYLKWTSDYEIITKYSEKIILIAGFPLKPEFLDEKSGLLHNSREYWERHSVHGIRDGFELAYQMWVIKGLKAAAAMGREYSFGSPDSWEKHADNLLRSLLNESNYGLADNGCLVKRRDREGNITRRITPAANAGLPDGIPLMMKGDHLLNPDSSVSQAIVYEIIDPESGLAESSMNSVEKLWNQGWRYGGYGRYDITSEPDSPGAWPFPSLFIARAYHKMGKYDKVERVLNWLNEIPGKNSCSWFENYGERISPPYPQVGITPWTWAEIIMLVVKDILGIELEGNIVKIKPSLLPAMKYFEAAIRVRGMIIDLKILRTGNRKKTEEVLVPIIIGRVSVCIEI